MKNKKIILHTSPPASIAMPSQGHAMLKAYLQQSGHRVDALYWNLSLYKMIQEFLKHASYSDGNVLLFFYNYWAVKKKDPVLYHRVKASLQGILPSEYLFLKGKLDKHMNRCAESLDFFLTKRIHELHTEDILYHGFSLHLYQWVGASVIAGKIKELYPEVPVVVGGVGTKEVAVAYATNFKQFDYVIWGEGEDSLQQLSDSLVSGQMDHIETIPGLVFRRGKQTQTSVRSKREYLSFGQPYPYPDFQDYFDQKKQYGITLTPTLTFETSRACHWNQCLFCYLNTGYQYRTKTPEDIIKELRYLINRYEISFFSFVDNDVVGKNLKTFTHLLDLLIELKTEYPKFTIHMAEIITRDLNASIIKKMALAGFFRIQFGYESPSNNLLKKIRKKNTFASNLLFIKYAVFYNLQIAGANIIRNLPEETEEDIREGIDNLYFLRFFLRKNRFTHQTSSLTVCSNSKKDYKKLLDDPAWGYHDLIHPFLPAGMIREEDEICINEKRFPTHHFLWNQFDLIEKNVYLTNEFSYQLLSCPEGIRYREYSNKINLLNELEIPYSSLSYDILTFANEKVVSLDELRENLEETLSPEEVVEEIHFLQEEGLIYATKDYSELVSVINMQLAD